MSVLLCRIWRWAAKLGYIGGRQTNSRSAASENMPFAVPFLLNSK